MAKKNKIETGLYFGITMSVLYITQSLWVSDDLSTKNIIIYIISGLVAGALSGFLYGWIIRKFVISKYIRDIKIKTEENETILFETTANHFVGIEAVGGKLFLTNERLVFKSHNLNIHNHELSVPLYDIGLVGRYKTLGLVNNGLSITTAGNKVEKFVVEQIESWIDQLGDKTELHSLQML